MKRSLPVVLALAIGLGLGLGLDPLPTAAEDILHLNTGGKVSGKIVYEDEEVVRVETPRGVTTVYRDEIVRIERISSASEEFKKRFAELERKRARPEVYYALGVWAEGHKLVAEARAAFERTIAIDPEHADARKKLGFVRMGRDWVPEAEAKRRRGLVEHEGQWVTPEEKELLEQGLVRVDGEWIPKELAEARSSGAFGGAATGAGAGGGGGEKPKPGPGAGPGTSPGDPAQPATRRLPQSPDPGKAFEPPAPEVIAELLERQKAEARHAEKVIGVTFKDVEEGPLLVHTTQDPKSEVFKETLKNLGQLYETESKIYSLKMDDPIWPGKLQIYFFKDKSEFDRFATDVDNAPGAVQSGGYFIWGFGGGYSKLHIAMYNLDLGTLAHEMSHAFMSRYAYSDRPIGPWLNEGTAEYMRYLVVLGIRGQEARHMGIVKQMHERADARATIRAMLEKPQIAGTEGWAYAVSWSIVDFLIKVDKKKYVAFLKALKRGDGSWNGRFRGATADEQAAALEAAFGLPMDKIEQAWRDHVQTYK